MGRVAALALVVALSAPGCGGATPAGGRPGELIRFTTEDGVELAGELRGEGRAAVVLAHMFPSDRTSWSGFATVLADRGYLTLALDFRGYGGSEGSKDIPEIWRDVLAAVEEVRARGATSVVLVGASMGGTAALLAAARTEIQGVATLSAASTFMGLSVEPDVLAASSAPKLFVAAEGDGVAPATARALYDASAQPKRVEIVAGGDHGTELLEGREGERVRRLLVEFVQRAAPPDRS